MYISVIPLRHSLSKYPYIYFVSETWQKDIKVGYLVEIPIGKHIVEGVISDVDVSLEGNIESRDIRSIIRVIATVEILAPYMIRMILDIADQYFLLIHKVASFFLPRSLLTHLDKKNYIITETPSILKEDTRTNKKERSHTQIHHFIDTIFSIDDISTYLVPESVFIFPDDILLSVFAESLTGNLRENIGIFPTDMTPSKRIRAWMDITGKKYSIIFGTRRILYYNLKAFQHIFYIEDAFGTEQYTYPIKIQNLDILKSCEKSNYHEITILTSTPSLMCLSLFGKNTIRSIRK